MLWDYVESIPSQVTIGEEEMGILDVGGGLQVSPHQSTKSEPHVYHYVSETTQTGAVTQSSGESRYPSIREIVKSLLQLWDIRVVRVEPQWSRSIGPYLLVEVDAPASLALKAWLELAPAARSLLGAPVFILWCGKTDLEPSEVGAMLGKILARMRVYLATVDVFDAVELLREEWNG